MRAAKEQKKTLEDLVEESRVLRDKLMKTVGALDAFTAQLSEEVVKLAQANAAGDPDE